MTKDEIKDRISMALKDPILQQGFEIICKNLSELEKRLSVLLSCKNCPDNKGGFICQKEYEDKCLAQKIQYIKELKEENAELKEKLTKAKEIIREYMRFEPMIGTCSFYSEEYEKTKTKAEQFLKEVSE